MSMEPHASKVSFRIYLIAARSAFASREAWLEAIVRVAAATARPAAGAGGHAAALQVRIEPEFAAASEGLARSALYAIRDVDPSHGLTLFINAPGAEALRLGYQGAHWREVDLPVSSAAASPRVGPLRSASVHSKAALRQAELAGADLALFGPVWRSLWKQSRPLGLEALRGATRDARIPVFALGGVTPERAVTCLEHGAHGVAVAGGVLHASDPGAALAQYASAIAGALTKPQPAGDA